MTTIEQIKDSFPNPTIKPIVGQPSYETIKPMHKKINTNAASVVTHLGNGHLGLLYLKVTRTVFTTLCEVALGQPVNPDPSPEIPASATQSKFKLLLHSTLDSPRISSSTTSPTVH